MGPPDFAVWQTRDPMAALERGTPFLVPLNAVFPSPLKLQRLHRSRSLTALSTRSTLSGGALPVVPCVVALTSFTRATARRGKGDKGDKGDKGGVQKWFEEKKAEGTAGVGGAVIGGMLGGPLGAVVGSQVASKLGPVLNDALDALETDEEVSDSQKSDSETKKPVEKAEKREAPLSSVELPESETPVATKEPQVATVSSATEPPPAQPSQIGLSEELQRLRDNAAEKQRKLETEIDDLYVKAEEALKTGNEESAREFLEARSKAQASLKRMMEGAEKRIQHQQEKVNDLEKEAEELYRKAEISLKAGEDEMARSFLNKRENILQRVQQLQDLAP